MTAHQKLQLVRHLESAIRGYGLQLERAEGLSGSDKSMAVAIAQQSRADAQETLTWVLCLETEG